MGHWKGTKPGPQLIRTKERALSQRPVHSGICTLKLGASPTKSSGVCEVKCSDIFGDGLLIGGGGV
jgi:hypothetical protein